MNTHSHHIDLNTVHDPDFEFRRDSLPHSSNLVICFRTAAIILTRDGTTTAQPGDCIVHSLDFRLYHRSVPDAAEGLRNDWFYVSPEVLTPLMEDYGLPWNKLIHTGKPEFLTSGIKRLREELFADDEFSERGIRNSLEEIVLSLSRADKWVSILREEMTVTERYHFELLAKIRLNLIENCRQEFTVDDLASEANLSAERFTVLYRKFFAKTPYAELIDSRLVIARRLLSTSNLSVKEISQECGWDDVHYFSRLFRKKTGIAPSHYRSLSQGKVNKEDC